MRVYNFTPYVFTQPTLPQDNSLDDAEALYTGTDGYVRPIVIDVKVARRAKTISVIDNCRGMEPDVLSRVVMRVGESR